LRGVGIDVSGPGSPRPPLYSVFGSRDELIRSLTARVARLVKRDRAPRRGYWACSLLARSSSVPGLSLVLVSGCSRRSRRVSRQGSPVSGRRAPQDHIPPSSKAARVPADRSTWPAAKTFTTGPWPAWTRPLRPLPPRAPRSTLDAAMRTDPRGPGCRRLVAGGQRSETQLPSPRCQSGSPPASLAITAFQRRKFGRRHQAERTLSKNRRLELRTADHAEARAPSPVPGSGRPGLVRARPASGRPCPRPPGTRRLTR
jgi:hypothetical protein